jgi:hypothetical protein
MANRSTSKTAPKKVSVNGSEQRKLRRNQIIFSVFSVIVILSWIVALLAK